MKTSTICMLGLIGAACQTEGNETPARVLTPQHVNETCQNLATVAETLLVHIDAETLPYCTLVQQYYDYAYHVVSASCKEDLGQLCVQHDIHQFLEEGCHDFHCPNSTNCCTPCPIGTCRKTECGCNETCSTTNCLATLQPTPQPTRVCSSSEIAMMDGVFDTLSQEYREDEMCEVLELFFDKLEEAISPWCYLEQRDECLSEIGNRQKECSNFACYEQNGAFINSFSVILITLIMVLTNW